MLTPLQFPVSIITKDALMLRFACCLLLFPAVAAAQQSVEPPQQLSETNTPRDESAPVESGSHRTVTVELMMLQISGDLKIDQPGHIPPERLENLIRDARGAGTFRYLTRIRMATLEQQPARFQMGATEVVPAGSSRGVPRRSDPRPGFVTTYQRQESGTITEVTPRVGDDGTIVLDIMFEQTRLQRTPPADNEVDSLIPPATASTGLNSKVSVPNGQTILAGSFHSAESQREPLVTFLFVSASTPPGDHHSGDASAKQP